MTKQKQTPLMGNPREAYQLSKDLLRTLKDSDLFKNGNKNHYVGIDIMVSIAQFTDLVIHALQSSAREKGIDWYSVYKNEILDTIHDPTESLKVFEEIMNSKAFASN